MASIDKRTFALSVIGMAFIWGPLHTTAYYPLSIAFTSQTTSVADISAYHIVYTMVFVAVAVAAVLARKRVQEAFDRSHVLPLACAVLGAVGSTLLVASELFNDASPVVVGIGIVLVAFCFVPLLIAWGSRMAALDQRTAALCIAGSYVVFSTIWLVFTLAGAADTVLLVASPLITGICLSALSRPTPHAWSYAPAALKSMPFGFVLPCIVFVYFGVLCVKALTAMQIGISVGALSNLHLTVTAAASLLMAGAMLLAFRAKGYAPGTLVLVFALLALCYLASLLAVLLGLDSEYLSFLGKRALVGSEHLIEAFLFIMLACSAQSKRFSPVLAFGLYAILIIAVPQFIASDLMYQTGILDALSHLDLIVPLVAVASFAIAAVAIGLLVRLSARIAVQTPAEAPDNWQEDLCRRAFASLELSPREFDVAVLAYRGYSAKSIASTLYVSESTVKTHTSHIYRKADIHSKQELIAYIDCFRDTPRNA